MGKAMWVNSARILLFLFGMQLGAAQALDTDKALKAKRASEVSLGQSVDSALAYSPSLKAAKYQIKIAKADKRIARAGRLPTLSLSAGIGREDSNNATTRALTGNGSDEYERVESRLNLRQVIFDGNARKSKQLLAETGLTLAEMQYYQKANKVAFDAIKAHLAVMKALLSLDVNIDNLKAHEKIAKEVSMRARSGKDNRAKVNQISARLSLALANVEQAKQNLNVARARYKTVTGEVVGQKLNYSPGLMSMPDSLEQLLSETLANNFEIKAAKAKLDLEKTKIKQAKASYFPEVYVDIGASWNKNLDGVAGQNNDSYAMLRMDYDLFDGGARYAHYDRSRVSYDRVQAELEEVQRSLTQEASEVWQKYQSSTRRLSLLEDYVDSARSVKKAYIKQFNIGQRTLIDLLDAENELLKAQRMAQDVRFELRQLKFHILYLQGQLLKTSA